MNPGRLDTPVTLQARSSGADELGQPVETWQDIGPVLFASRKLPKSVPEAEISDRKTERRTLSLRLRSQPFLTHYRPGHRLREHARRDFPETVWKITAWTEAPNTNGMYVDVECETPAVR